MQSKVPALAVGALALTVLGVSLVAQNTAGQKSESVTLTDKPDGFVHCAVYRVGPKGEVQAPSPFPHSTPIKERCDREGTIIAYLKPVLELDKKQMRGMGSELDHRIKKVKECFRQHSNMGDSECRNMQTSGFLSQTGHFRDQYDWVWRVIWSKNVNASDDTVSDSGQIAIPERVGPISVVSGADGKIITAAKQGFQPGKALKTLEETAKKGSGS